MSERLEFSRVQGVFCIWNPYATFTNFQEIFGNIYGSNFLELFPGVMLYWIYIKAVPFRHSARIEANESALVLRWGLTGNSME